MKLNKLFNSIKEIRVGDIVFDKTTDESCKFRYCKIGEINKNYVWGYWYETLENVKRNEPNSCGTLPGKIEDVVKI